MIALIDVDGVLADFIGGVLGHLKETTGCALGYDDVGEKHLFTQLSDYEKREANRYISSEGFCRFLHPIKEGISAINELRDMDYRVLFVTAPWNQSPTWTYDRTQWLHAYADADHKDIIYTSDKQHIRGNIFVDDLPKNVDAWHNANPFGMAFIKEQPWNAHLGGSSWGRILDQIERDMMHSSWDANNNAQDF